MRRILGEGLVCVLFLGACFYWGHVSKAVTIADSLAYLSPPIATHWFYPVRFMPDAHAQEMYLCRWGHTHQKEPIRFERHPTLEGVACSAYLGALHDVIATAAPSYRQTMEYTKMVYACWYTDPCGYTLNTVP